MRARLLTLFLLGAALLAQGSVARADPPALPAAGVPWFLALGDSITWGYSLDSSHSGNEHSWAARLRDRLAAAGHPLAMYDLGCPSETTLTYVRGGCPARHWVPELDGRSQRRAALDAIAQRGASLKLVVLALGINDWFHVARRNGGFARFDPIAARLDAIVAELQSHAPGIPIVLSTTYDPWGTADSVAATVYLNSRIAAVAQRRGAALADWLAFVDPPGTAAAARCALIDCAHGDIHPTPEGQDALAAAAWTAVPTSLR